MALIYIALAAYGAYLAWQPVLNTLPKSMSFDQENLKKHDSGCPTAVYTVIDGELGASDDQGGLGQQRHPGLPDSELDRKTPPDHVTDLGLDDAEDDISGQGQTIERLRAAAGITRAHAMNEGEHHRGGDNDLLPAF